MINVEDLTKNIGQRFWRHIHKETLIPYKGRIPNRTKFLYKLKQDIGSMKYVPSPPRGYVISHKQNLVVRFVPALKHDDYCVYFHCVKCLEDEIAKNRVKGTYGGWKLGGKMRKEEKIDDVTSMPDNSYNRFAWKQAWTDFQSKAYLLKQNMKLRYFIIFDIANFYDSIRLRRLEILIREAVGKNKTEIVNLLFYFLSNWGKGDMNYDRQNIGLPQDEVGDCSRILANLYLQDYDRNLYEMCNRYKSRYLRYADDQIIAAPNEKLAKKIMFLASRELVKLGLNLNASKAKLLPRDKFDKYWSFDIFKLLSNPNNPTKIVEAWEIFKQRRKSNVVFKPDTVLKRILNCNLSKLQKKIRLEILSEARSFDFVTSIDDYYLGRIYKFLKNKNRADFICQLNNVSDEVLFNQFHLRVIKFAKENRIKSQYLGKIKQNLVKLNAIN